MRLIFTLLLLLILLSAKSQDTLTVMSYNILNYPLSNATKADTLKAIIQHSKPDIFMITELTSSSGVTSILNNALNVDGVNYYSSATYYNGPDTDNMLFYNNQKFGLKSQYEIPTVLRNISEYVLYYKSSDIATTSDTVFIHCYMAHLKASNTPSDSIQRNQEAVSFKNYLDSKAQPIENIVLGGDFNVYTSQEAAFNTILNGGSVLLKDPINTPGDWNNNFAFAAVHTQSTRTNVLPDGGSTGGLDDRFDIIFVGQDVLSGTNKLKYITNTYKALGNDGQHFNKSINASPTNTAVPANVADALYYMSDHLPIVMKLYYDAALSVDEFKIDNQWNGYFYSNRFYFKSNNLEKNAQLVVYDVIGKKVDAKTFNSTSFELDYSNYNNGLYFVKVITPEKQQTYRIVKQ